MIPLNRIRTNTEINPAFLGNNRERKLVALFNLRVSNGKDIPSKEFDSQYWKAAKDQLKSESNNKCAYCECSVPEVAHGDVEHFRPKAQYWWLAYCYDNYLFSCQICNQVYKNDNFPVSGQRLREPVVRRNFSNERILQVFDEASPDPISSQKIVRTFLTNLQKEGPLLPNPYYENPESYFVWVEDEVKRTVMMQPNTKKRNSKLVFEKVDEFYGINREELVRLRFNYLRHFKIYKKAVSNNIDKDIVSEANKMIAEMISDAHPFAGMMRYFNKIL
jgi:uncharacterized protein (TIGR02646 family)